MSMNNSVQKGLDLASGGGSSAQSAPALASLLSPWWDAAGLGTSVVGAGIGAYMNYLAFKEQKKQARQAQRNREREFGFKEQQYKDGAPQRSTDLTRSNYSAAEEAQNWRDRLAAMRIWS